MPLQLSGKLACLLIQLPPRYAFNFKNLEEFFKILDPRFHYAVEFRNTSWLKQETWDLLKQYDVSYTNVDEPLLPPEVHLTSDLAYFRWHGHGEKVWFDYNYNKQELDAWTPKIKETASKAKKILGYFNNHFHGYAPENCEYLLQQLGLSSARKKLGVEKASVKQSRLGDFAL